MKVTAAPVWSSSALRQSSVAARLPETLTGETVRFYFSGSNAIWNGMGGLGLQLGEKVLFPAYHCGAELDAVVRAGCAVAFYRLDDRLRVDLDSVKQELDSRARALFIIHYFGFPQPLDEILDFCRSQNLCLIEDCAHALYTEYRRRPVGTMGQMAIFSLRKFLPLPEGGALRLSPPCRLPTAVAPPWSETWAMMLWEAERALRGREERADADWSRQVAAQIVRFTAGLGRRVGALTRAPRALDPSIDFSVIHGRWGISRWSLRMLARLDHTQVMARRRTNFQQLFGALKGCRGLRLLVDELAEGVCPWVCPIVVSDAPSLIAHLRQREIDVAPFWSDTHRAFPLGAFPDVRAWKGHVIGLPVHQGLDDDAIRYMAEQIALWRN